MMGLAVHRCGIGPAVAGSSFTDDFDRGAENLEVSADWTRVDGSAGDISVFGGTRAYCNTSSSTGAAYRCPDQGAGDKYVEGHIYAPGFTTPLCMRLTDANNWIGLRYGATSYQLLKRNAGTISVLGSYTASHDITHLSRLEMVGNDFEVFINGVSRITATDSFNSSETRQGMVARVSVSPMLEDFGAGTL